MTTYFPRIGRPSPAMIVALVAGVNEDAVDLRLMTTAICVPKS